MMYRKLAPIALLVTVLCLALPQRSFAAVDEAFTTASVDQQASLAGDAFQALVTKVVRKVEWQRYRTHMWQGVTINNLLMVGDTLRTGAEAKAELLYGDGSVTRVGSLTSLTLAGEDRRELHLDSGRVWLHIMKHNAGMKVITPGAVAAVTGTELMVEFDAVKQTTEVTVFEGAVNVTGDVGNIVRVTGGTTTHVPFHSPAAAPAPLDNRKLQERENIFRPLSVQEDPNAVHTSTSDPTAKPLAPNGLNTPKPAVTTGPATAELHPEADTTTGTPTAAPVAATPPTKPVQPDLKAQTGKLLDPRLINGSPTTGRVKVIIE